MLLTSNFTPNANGNNLLGNMSSMDYITEFGLSERNEHNN